MKKIMYAGLRPDFNSDISGKFFRWTESSEAEYGTEWGGNVRGYLENLDIDHPEEYEFLENGSAFTIDDLPSGALIIGWRGKPVAIWWAEDEEAADAANIGGQCDNQ